ncbi:MAG: HAD family hydrolase [Enterococcus faecium]|uniref:Magnesium-transporting ATPase n=1 Tax=Enterococcus mundtii TaxID=53346 RepID=A0A2T5DEL2_ENTMU|nr:HAD-IC family P-type ATPase [Enterococcus mundtii]MBE6171245.1 HAD family hydrolase [Enterococcus faecium]PTO36449.1 magnesium-transporting ATPase [Enterococcus mundtii]
MEEYFSIIPEELNEKTGLNGKQIEERILKNKSNQLDTQSAGKTTKEIILKNCMTLFNFLNVMLFITVISIGSFRNSFFMVSILVNTSMGIFQEIKAKKTIEKLSVLKQNQVTVLREGKEVTIKKEEIVLDDLLFLAKGMQVPVDVCALSQGLFVDESMITGESELVEKMRGDTIYSGSLVMQGKIKSIVTQVGEETYIAKLTKEAKSFKPMRSKIQIAIDRILRVIAIGIIPIALLVLLNQFVLSAMDLSLVESRKLAIIGSTTAISSLIPEGLVLLTSVALAAGVIKLSKIKVLAQSLPAIETLARVDVLCLDKTGTITEGKMSVEEVVYYHKTKEEIDATIAFLLKQDTESNMSTEALKKVFHEDTSYRFKKENYVPFSSESKSQAIEINGQGTFVLGAFDLIVNNIETSIKVEIESALKAGYRILAFAHTPSSILDNQVPKDGQIIALILIKDKAKSDAKQILTYFKEQGIKVKIISGDHPDTVAGIARDVGIKGKAISSKEIPDSKNELREIVEETSIFGRITPDQKRDLVQALQENGHTVAMVGDGINDILALKKSDCGITFGIASEAVKSVTHFILLEGNFSVLPQVVREGRKVINNINRVAGMNILRVIYALTLILLLTFSRQLFPIESINLALVSSLAIGVPCALLILENDDQKIKDDFFRRIKVYVIPAGVTIGLTIMVMYMITYYAPIYSKFVGNIEVQLYVDFVVDATLIIGLTQFYLLYLLCRPLTVYRIKILFFSLALFFISYFIPVVNEFFGLSPVHSFRFFVPVVLSIVLLTIISRIVRDRTQWKSPTVLLLTFFLFTAVAGIGLYLQQLHKDTVVATTYWGKIPEAFDPLTEPIVDPEKKAVLQPLTDKLEVGASQTVSISYEGEELAKLEILPNVSMFDKQGIERKLNLPMVEGNPAETLHPGVYVKAEASNVSLHGWVIVDAKDVPTEVKKQLIE